MLDSLGLGLVTAVATYVLFLFEHHAAKPKLRPVRIAMGIVSLVLLVVTVTRLWT